MILTYLHAAPAAPLARTAQLATMQTRFDRE